MELESRAIMLSLEEDELGLSQFIENLAKEIKRMIMLNVFAKNPESKAADEARTTTQGAQLPAIVSTKAHSVQTIMCLLLGDSEQDLAFHSWRVIVGGCHLMQAWCQSAGHLL